MRRPHSSFSPYRPVVLLAVLFFLVSLAAALSAPARAQSNAQETSNSPPAMRLSDVERGQLLFLTTEPGRYAPAPLIGTEVNIDVSGPIARTTVRQHFANPTGDWLEGRYVFPLPDRSAVDRMTMTVGNRTIEAKIAEREEARRTYEAAKQDGRRAALVEQHRPNVFSNDVANIPPGGRITVELHYLQTLDYDAGGFALRFPLVVAPRFDPNAGPKLVSHDPDAPTPTGPTRPQESPRLIPVHDSEHNPALNPVTLQVSVDAGVEIGRIASASHEIVVDSPTAETRVVRLKDAAVPADRDFVLEWSPALGAMPRIAAFRERTADAVYALAMILPPANDIAADAPAPRDVVFILDRSGSMGGRSIRAARGALQAALDRLSPADRFNLIRFSDETDALFDADRPADRGNLLTARAFLNATDATGGTVIRPALMRALSRKSADRRERLRQVVFLTDGAVSNETELFGAISGRLGASRLFTVGIGSAPNSWFMRKAAEAGRGSFVHIGDLDRVEPEMAKLFAKLERPATVGLEARWKKSDSTAQAADSYPRTVPDLYFVEPVVVVSRLPLSALADGAALTLDAKDWRAKVPLKDAAEAEGIGTLWARARIEELTDAMAHGTPETEIKPEVTRLALAHHLLSSYTSLVAVEQEASRPEDAPLVTGDAPINLPAGWRYDTTMGGSGSAADAAPGSLRLKRSAAPPPAPAGAAQEASLRTQTVAVDLPRGATPMALHLIAGIGLLLMSLMLVVALRVRRPLPARRPIRSR